MEKRVRLRKGHSDGRENSFFIKNQNRTNPFQQCRDGVRKTCDHRRSVRRAGYVVRVLLGEGDGSARHPPDLLTFSSRNQPSPLTHL